MVENGNHYYLSIVDCKLLYSAVEIYGGATFAPNSGFRKLFPELYILSVIKGLGNNIIIGIPAATSKTEANYEQLKTIKDIVKVGLKDGILAVELKIENSLLLLQAITIFLGPKCD